MSRTETTVHPSRTSHKRKNRTRRYCSLLFTTVPWVLASLRTEPPDFASGLRFGLLLIGPSLRFASRLRTQPLASEPCPLLTELRPRDRTSAEIRGVSLESSFFTRFRVILRFKPVFNYFNIGISLKTLF